MKIRQIVDKSAALFAANRKGLMIIFIYISVFQSLVNSVGNVLGGVFGMIAPFVTAVLAHGHITAAYKVIKQDRPLDLIQDSFCGWIRFRELWSTYTVMEIFYTFGGALITSIIYLKLFPGLLVFDPGALTLAGQAAMYETTQRLMMISLVVLTVVEWFCSLLFAAAPYLLENKKDKGIDSVVDSIRLLKGHRLELFRLQLYFLAPAAICFFLDYLLWYYLDAFLASLLRTLLSIFSMYLYEVTYRLALTLFYDEILAVEVDACVNS